MEVKDIVKTEINRGTASTVKVEDFVPYYIEGVKKFLRDNQSVMGDEWVKMAGSRLYSFQGKNEDGDILGSSTDVGVAIATFCPEIPLITGQQLLELYKQAGDKNPFGAVYIDFGVVVEGDPRVNPIQSKSLLNDFRAREIELGAGRVPNFAQLRLIADSEAGLSYKSAEGVSTDNVAVVPAYPFQGRVGKNGLFGAYLSWHGWCGYYVDLPNSSDAGQVVRYDTEGVARAKPRPRTSDLIDTLEEEFTRRF